MKLAYLTEVAAIMAAHSQLFIEQSEEISAEALGDYYIHSRNRFNRWMRDLDGSENTATHRDSLRLAGPARFQSMAIAVTQQVLINDMVARIWTLLLLARDANNGIDRTQPVARNIYLGHLSVRHKALRVLLTDDRVSPDQLMAIDKLRKSIERWTDLLGCSLMRQFNLWEYAFDKERATEFFRDRADQPAASHQSRSWVLILAGLRHSFQDTDGLSASIHEDDRRLVRLMLNSFPESAPEMKFWMGPRVHAARPC
ncbi:MAG: hypothetical protein KDB01_27885 [Planctomycetaceae bacterium]|nr:hypothetical protein [Planctomycetaceae bacterium]